MLKTLTTVSLAMMLAACTRAERWGMPQEIVLYGNQVQYYYEDPSLDRMKMAIAYRSDALAVIFRQCDASSYRHAVTIDEVFYGLANEKFKHGMWPDNIDTSWTSAKIRLHEVKYSGDLDYFWSAYSATGDIEWIDKIYTYIDSSDASIAGAALWSLRANYRQHRSMKYYVDTQPAYRTIIDKR